MLTLLELKKFLITKLFQTLLSRLYMQKLLKKKKKESRSRNSPLAFLQALFISVLVFVSEKRIKLKPT